MDQKVDKPLGNRLGQIGEYQDKALENAREDINDRGNPWKSI